jgi:hypothetical protein
VSGPDFLREKLNPGGEGRSRQGFALLDDEFVSFAVRHDKVVGFALRR